MKKSKKQRMTSEKFDAIKTLLKSGARAVKIAEIFECSRATIYRISKFSTLEEYSLFMREANAKKKEKLPVNDPIVAMKPRDIDLLEQINTKLGVIENVLIALKNEDTDSKGNRPFGKLLSGFRI